MSLLSKYVFLRYKIINTYNQDMAQHCSKIYSIKEE